MPITSVRTPTRPNILPSRGSENDVRGRDVGCAVEVPDCGLDLSCKHIAAKALLAKGEKRALEVLAGAGEDHIAVIDLRRDDVAIDDGLAAVGQERLLEYVDDGSPHVLELNEIVP